MRKYLSILILVLLLIGCGLKRIQPKSHIYKDLSFGMSYEEVSSKGYCVGQQAEEDGYSTYKCKFSDYAGLQYKEAKLCFKENRLAKISFYFSTEDALEQQDFSKTITNYLTENYGPSQEVKNCVGWKDDDNTFIVYYHSDVDSSFRVTYVNELAIFSNELNEK
nr:hypothetical protein [uncultured Prevotella sp.]